MIQRLLAVWLCFACMQMLHSQDTKTIRGQVLDKDSKYPLIGAKVVVIDTGTVLGTATDEKGYFKLDVPLGRVSLSITYTGYKEERLNNLLVISGKEINQTIE